MLRACDLLCCCRPGVYVPMLTREVVRGNAAGVQPHINIKVCCVC